MKNKKMFSGFIVAILSLFIAAFCFAGCSGGNTSESAGNSTSTSEQQSGSDIGSSSATGSSESESNPGASEQPIKKQFTVTAPAASDKYTFDGANKATEGEDYTFVVAKAAGAHGTLTVTATMGGQNATVETTDDGYKIAAVNGDIVITVTYEDKLVNVTKSLCTGVNFVGEEKATVGSDYKFKVGFEEGYTAADDFEVLVNGVAVTADSEGYYIVSAVKKGFVIEVKGVKTLTYKATYIAEGVAADAIDKTKEEIAYGNEKYTISFTVSDKYGNSKEGVKVFVKVGDGEEQEVLPVDGAYVIDNPKADITVIVKGLKINTYKVNFVVNGDVFYCLDKVEHGTAVTEEMLKDAADELAAQGLYEVVGWGEVPATVTEYTYIEPKVTGKLVVDSYAWSGVGCPAGLGTFTTCDETAPEGFETVSKKDSDFPTREGFYDGKRFMNAQLSHIDISAFSMVSFAVKSNGIFAVPTSMSDEIQQGFEGWVVVTLTQNAGSWHINIKNGDTVIGDFNYTGSLGDYSPSLCAFLWHCTSKGFTVIEPAEGNFVVYSTEVRGVIDADKVGESVVRKIITDATETADTVLGFEKAYHYKAQGTPVAGTAYASVADTDITAYNHLEFYVKVTGSWILFDGWSHYFEANRQWVKVEANKTAAQEWKVSFNGKSTTRSNVTTLNQLLTFEMDTRDSSIEGASVTDCVPSEITITEIRGKKGLAPAEPQGTLISDNVYGNTSDASIAVVKTNEVAPAGFVNVYSYKSAPKAANKEEFIHGMYFSRADITEYSTVSFAMKTNCKYQLDNPARVLLGNGWIIFKLDQAQDGTWTLTLTNEKGEVVHSADKLTGTNVFEILWSNRTTSYCPVNDEETGVSLKVWTTDVRGVLRTAE